MESIIEARQLGKSFGGLRALMDVSFAVAEGSITAIIGPNGAGKTTLFNIISGLDKPDSGQILFKKKDITGDSPHKKCRMGLARTFQNLKLFKEMSVLENVLVGMHIHFQSNYFHNGFKTKLSVQEETSMLNTALDSLREFGLEGTENFRADTLPFGKQRLLEIVRAWVSRPSIILLDEPAAGLNRAETQVLAGYIKGLRDRGVTVLLIEHDMKFVMSISDWLIVLNYGQKIFEGTTAQVKGNSQVIDAYLGKFGRAD